MEADAVWPTGEVRHRDPTVVAVLSFVTLGIYWFYLIYVWSKDVNRLLEREKYPPGLMLALSIITCGLVGGVVECLIANDLADSAPARYGREPNRNLLAWVIALNVTSFVTAAILPLIGIVFAIPLGIAATVMVQMELNRFVHVEPA